MNTKTPNSFFLFFFAIVFYACTKESPPVVDPPEDPQGVAYSFPNTAGSYWIYKWVEIDSVGQETDLDFIDTVKILGDTSWMGETFVVYSGQLMGGNYEQTLLRDSSGYIIDTLGQIQQSYVDFSDTLTTGSYPSAWDFHTRMGEPDEPKTVPAGTFETIQHEQIFYFPSGDPVNDCGDYSFRFVTHINPEIGEISRQANLAFSIEHACSMRERRLVDYHIE